MFFSGSNYVVQKLVTLRIPRVTNNIIRKLEKNFVYLSCNKSASHVVEKLFKNSGEMQSRCIIFELLTDSNNRKLLVDPFANFVIGSALEISRVSHLRMYIKHNILFAICLPL